MEWSRRHSLIGNHPNYSRSKITWPLRIQMKKKGDLCPKYLENTPLLKGCVYAVSVMHTMQISILCLYLRTGAKYTICTVSLSCISLFRKMFPLQIHRHFDSQRFQRNCSELMLGVEQKRNWNFVQESKFLFSSEDYQKYRHSGYNCQEESRKNILSFSLSL